MNKTAIKNFAIWARNKLIADITYKAGLMGVTEKGIADPLPQSTGDMQFFDIGTTAPYSISREELAQRRKLVEIIKGKAERGNYKTAFNSLVEEVAYTWFNRLIAVRFMEVNDYLPSRVRVLSSESPNKAEPDLVTAPFDADLSFSDKEKVQIAQLKLDNKLDELFRMLFIKQCNALNTILPELFESTSDYSELLLNISYTDKDGVVSHLVNDIAEDDFKDQVQIIGWLYQYYNIEPKQAVFDGLKKNVKITKEKIPAATQLFTPDWIVRYMVENSLGRLWLEGHPNDDLVANWKYYLGEAEQTPEVKAQLENLRAEYKNINPEDIKVIDPCMGSGHILVYAFDVLIQIYRSAGYADRDSTKLILEKNLYGLDIDKRAYQLAYFSLIMKARQYNRRILSEGIAPQVYHPSGWQEGEEFGSLNKIIQLERKPEMADGQLNFDDADYEQKLRVWNYKRLLAEKYDVVVTNPPYMGGSGMNGKLAQFVKDNYPDSKSDLFAAFIERCASLTNNHGISAMITQHSWMFLSSYEKLRQKLRTHEILNMAHLGARAFAEIGGEVVQCTAFTLRSSHIANYNGLYVRLVDFDNADQKEIGFLSGNHRYIAQADNFIKIPGMPISYWASENMLDSFKHKRIGDVYIPKFGMSVGDSDKFIRLWHEVEYLQISFHATSNEDYIYLEKTWNILDKGGQYRRWYGNRNHIVFWENGGAAVKQHPSSAVRSPQYFFKPHVSWTLVTSGNFSCRYFEEGFILDTASNCIYLGEQLYGNLLGFLNSKVASKILNFLNPTLNMSCGVIAEVPLNEEKVNAKQVEKCVLENIFLSRTDWDSFETSWDFKRHPLV